MAMIPEWGARAAASAGVGLGLLAVFRLVQFSLTWAKVRRGLKGVWTPKILEALAIALYKQPDKRQQLFTFLERQADATPTTPQFLRQARYLAMAGEADNANVAYIKAMQFAGDSSPQPFIEAARFYVARRDNDSALTALQYANYVDPGNAEVYALFRQIGVVPGPSQQVPPPDPGKYPAPRPYNGN